MNANGPAPIELINGAVTNPFKNMKIQRSILGYVMSCIIYVPIKKLQGQKDKLNPIM